MTTNKKGVGPTSALLSVVGILTIAALLSVPLLIDALAANENEIFISKTTHAESFYLQNNGTLTLIKDGTQLCNATTDGALYYNNSDFYACDGSSWASITSGGATYDLDFSNGSTGGTITDAETFTFTGGRNMTVECSGNQCTFHAVDTSAASTDTNWTSSVNGSTLFTNASGDINVTGTWNSLVLSANCEAITGSADLCDGSDDGAGGGDNTSWNESYANTLYHLQANGVLDNTSWNETRFNTLTSAWDQDASDDITDHGALTGLTDDDHTHYMNQARFNSNTTGWDQDASDDLTLAQVSSNIGNLTQNQTQWETVAAGEFSRWNGTGFEASTPAGATDTNCSTPGSCASVAYMNYANDATFYAPHFNASPGGLTYNVYDDGNEMYFNMTGVPDAFHIDGTDTRLTLYQNPVAGNDWKVFEVSHGAGVTGFVVSEAGTNRATYATRSFKVGGTNSTCNEFTDSVDCDASGTGADLVVQDDAHINGTVYSHDWSNVSITETQISDLTHTTDTNWTSTVNGSTAFLNTTGGEVNVTGTWNNLILDVIESQLTCEDITGSADLCDGNDAGGGGSPGGSDTEVQFNSGGSFTGSTNFTYDDTTNELNLSGENDQTVLRIRDSSGNTQISMQGDGNLTLASGSHLDLPRDNDAGTPTIMFDETAGLATGIFAPAAFDMRFVSGSNTLQMASDAVKTTTSFGFSLQHETSSNTNPVFTSQGDSATGIGFCTSAGCISIIEDGKELVRFDEDGPAYFTSYVPANLSNGTYINATGCDSLDTNADGLIICGNDATGAAGVTGNMSIFNVSADSGGVSYILNNTLFNITGGTDISTSISGRDITIDYTGGAHTVDTNWTSTVNGSSSFAGEVSGTWNSIVLGDDALNDHYVQLEGDTMTGNLTMGEDINITLGNGRIYWNGSCIVTTVGSSTEAIC